jgi:hypothetical protein
LASFLPPFLPFFSASLVYLAAGLASDFSALTGYSFLGSAFFLAFFFSGFSAAGFFSTACFFSTYSSSVVTFLATLFPEDLARFVSFLEASALGAAASLALGCAFLGFDSFLALGAFPFGFALDYYADSY